MKNQKLDLFESKLKRLKISFYKENHNIIIGKPKMDYAHFIGLIIIPFLFAIIILLYYLTFKSDSIRLHTGKVFAIFIFFLGTSIFNFSRMKAKWESNASKKKLINNKIIINTESEEYFFDADTVTNFEINITDIKQNTNHGKLYLVDLKNEKHLLLGFDNENEKYLLDDLKWFASFFANYINFKSDRILIK